MKKKTSKVAKKTIAKKTKPDAIAAAVAQHPEAQQTFDLIPNLERTFEVTLPHDASVKELEDQFSRVVIANIEDYRKGELFMQTIKRVSNQVEADQKELLGPLSEFLRWGNAQFKVIKDRLDLVMRGTKTRMIAFNDAQEALLKEQQRRAREEQEARALEAAGKAKTPEEAEALLNAAIEAPMPQPAIRGMGTSTPMKWVARPQNTKQICQAIVDGHLPTDIIKEFSTQNLNAFAKRHAKEETIYGLLVVHEKNMTVRA